jgi:class 3 adenylate cyclase
MPLFMDVHDLPGVTAEDVAHAHKADLMAQGKLGVKYVKYWFNQDTGKVFCLAHAPSMEAAIQVHRDAHGLVANGIIEVQGGDVAGFLGSVPDTDVGAAAHEDRDGSKLDGGFRTVMFTDMVSSTATTQRLGDKAAMELVKQHDAVVRSALSAWNGKEVKHTGDGIMAAFRSATQANAGATQIQQALDDYNRAHAAEPIQVRIGLSAGEPVEDSSDLFGATVQLAARVCAHAQPCEILVTNVVAELCVGKGYRFEPQGQVPLKGFDSPSSPGTRFVRNRPLRRHRKRVHRAVG